MQTKTARIIEEFVSNVDETKLYNIRDLNRILSNAYKSYGKDVIVRLPSEYNTFMRAKITSLKESQKDKILKELLPLAHLEWLEYKKQYQDDSALVEFI